MSNPQATATVIAKPTRADEERSRRRRREDMGNGRFNQLAVDGTKDPNYVYRWINDEPGRVHTLTQLDDWDVVTAGDIGRSDKDKGVGTSLERVVDRASGKRGILVRKLKEFYVSDKAKEQASIDETDRAIKSGRPAQGPEGFSGTDAAKAYVPQGAISIQDGRKG